MSELDLNTNTPAEATPSAPPAAATQAVPAAAPAIPTPTTQTPATGVPEGYVPSYRLRETREAAERQAATQYAQREAQIRAEAEQYKAQLHRLVGVTPPQDPQIDAVRQQFAQLYPGLAQMETRAKDLMGVLERSGDAEAQTQHYWGSYARQTMDRLYSHATESLGTPLTDEGKRVLHASFTGWVNSSPELASRYERDTSLVEDFWKAFTSNFTDPIRRSANAQVGARIGGIPSLPQDTPGGAPRATPAPQHANLDERAAAAWTQYQQTNRNR